MKKESCNVDAILKKALACEEMPSPELIAKIKKMGNCESNEEFLAKCRQIDFSADNPNFEKNLEKLKRKLANENDELDIAMSEDD